MTISGNIFDIKEDNEPKSKELQRAFEIFEDGVESVNHLFSVYKDLYKGSGSPTNKQQDLLRALLVMAAATVDATIKRIIKDTWSSEKISSSIQSTLLSTLEKISTREIVGFLLDETPRKKAIEFVINKQTEGSLQSVEGIQDIHGRMGIKFKPTPSLKQASEARNNIVHEMDMDRSKTRKKGQKRRISRRKDDMVKWGKAYLEVAANFLKEVDKLLKSFEIN